LSKEQENVEEAVPETEQVTIQEQEETQPLESEAGVGQTAAALSTERVAELLSESPLSKDAQKILEARVYADEDEIGTAIREMADFVKLVSGAGQPFAQGDTQPAQTETLTAKEQETRDQERFNALMAEEDPAWIANLTGR